MAVDDDMLAEHRRMWHTFCRLVLYVLILVVIVLGGLGIFVA